MTTRALYAGPTPEDIARIPAVLTSRRQWILWRAADRLDKETGNAVGLEKIPINPQSLYGGSTTDSDDWGTFDDCLAALPVALEAWEEDDPSGYRGGGLGYVFTGNDPYTGADLDHCRDAQTGAIAAWAQTWIDTLASYTQASCSGTGLHCLVEATLPPGRRQSGDYQMWNHSRFFAMTGWHIAGTPCTIEPRQIPLTNLWCSLFAPQAGQPVWCLDTHGVITNKDPLTIAAIAAAPSGELYAQFAETSTGHAWVRCELATPTTQQETTPALEDTRVLELATQAKNGAKFTTLWQGEWTGYPSQSEADLSLLCRLAFYSQDMAQLDRLFRQSGLMRDKWEQRDDYRIRSLTAAITLTTTRYAPHDGARLVVKYALQAAHRHQNGHATSQSVGTAMEAATALLDRLKAAEEDDRIQLLYDAIDTILAPLSPAEWAVWVDRAKMLLGTRLNRNELTKARNEAIARHRSAAAQEAAQRVRTQDARPNIEVLSDIAPPVDELQTALLACHETPLYQRGRFLCHIGPGGPKLKWLQRPPDMPQILLTSSPHLRELASRAARFWVWDARGNSMRQSAPPLHIIETLMARDSWPFPPLEAIVNIPTLCPDGTILVQQGYHPDSGLFLDFNGVTFPPLPRHLDFDAARSALGRLQEVFIDFCYVNNAVHFSATIAALLSCVCRYAILGHVPLFAVRSTTRGSGKGKLIDAISLVAIGRSAPRAAQTQDEEEERKRLLSLALAGVPILHIDNVSHPLGSGPLDLALTAPTFGDRALGKNEHREAPLTCVFFASGNQMQFAGDMARRVIPIDLDPKRERPEERDDFRHPELEQWVEANRPRLVMDALTLMAAYFASGAPTCKLSAFGSYEAWSRIIRQALVWAGESDPCEARMDVEAESDPKYEMRDRLLHQWETVYSTTAKTLKHVVQEIVLYAATKPNPPNKYDDLRAALGAFDRRYDGQKIDTTAVGDGIRAMQGVVIDGRRLVKDGTEQRAVKWKIEKIS